MTKLSLAREKLVELYIESLKQDQMPWKKRWIGGANMNGITKKEYKGVNQLLLSLVAYNRKYDDPRWLTYVQIKNGGYKLKNAKGKGVPVEFWSAYDKINKKRIDFSDYEKIIDSHPKERQNYAIFCAGTFVYNATHVEGLPKLEINKEMENVKIPRFINNIFKNFGVKYSEFGTKAFYVKEKDEIVLPPKERFFDKYSYYATQLHELCHSTGHEKRLNRNLGSKKKKDEAREELIAEISSSFLMQKLKVEATAEHYENHKTYIQSWIKILEDKPDELFKAISESNKVFDYVSKASKIKTKEKER